MEHKNGVCVSKHGRWGVRRGVRRGLSHLSAQTCLSLHATSKGQEVCVCVWVCVCVACVCGLSCEWGEMVGKQISHAM